jgi:Fe2+ transport system protein FeoA
MYCKIISCTSSRLLELGFIPDTIAFLIDLKKFGKVFQLRGSQIGLRNSDMNFLELEEIC